MNNDSRWTWFLAGRIAVHVLTGALFCALSGAALIAASGALTGWILDNARGPFPSSIGSVTTVGAIVGALFGGTSAAVVGGIALGIVGLLSPPRRYYFPTKIVLGRILLGMSLATVGIMSSFFVLMAFMASIRHTNFSLAVGDAVVPILFAAPTAMVCGLIVGAVQGLRREKEARGAASPLPNLTE